MPQVKGKGKMKKTTIASKAFLLGLLAFAVLLTLAAGHAMAGDAAVRPKYEPFVPTDPIMPISQVRPGMKGECRTVVRGTEVVRFPVEVLEIIPRSTAPHNLILIKVGGKVIEETGGIAAGMSGSPVYIGGKLVGAIGYGWNFSRHDMGLVTSIEDMMALWNNPERIPSFSPAPIIPEKPRVREPRTVSADAEVASGDASPEAEEPPRETEEVPAEPLSDDAIVPATAPLLISGVSGRMAESIGQILGRSVLPYGGSSSGTYDAGDGSRSKRARYDAKLVPGQAIAASLLWGDIEVSAIGTLTAVGKDGRFLAFAHPFIEQGATSAAFMEARIARVVPGLSSPFKLGTTGDIVGIVTQDRPQGIGGHIGRFAPAASCTINMLDVDAGRSFRRRFQMVQDKYLLSNLASTAIVGCIEDLWGRKGGGSAKVTTTYSGSALLEGWKRTNVFVSEADVAAEMLKEFSLLTQLFAVNQFQELRPFGVDVDVEMTEEPRVLYIEDVKIPNETFRPGETVSFDITLRPWRKAPFVRTYSLTIPEKVTGICELLVRGGGIAEENAEYMEAAWRSISSLPILLQELDAKETNDQIVLEIRGQEALETQIQRARQGNPEDLMNDKLKSEMRAEKVAEGSMRIVRTNYYVDGIIHKLIKVEGGTQQ